MNKVYRVIWNSALRCYVVAPEIASGRTKSSGTVLSAVMAVPLLTLSGSSLAETSSSIRVNGIAMDISNTTISNGLTNGYAIQVTGNSTVSIEDSSATTTGTGAHGLLAQGGSITGSNVSFTTSGAGARGVLAQGTGNTVSLDDLSISTAGDGAYGVQVANTSSVTLNNATIATTGSNAIAIMAQGGSTTASNLNLSTSGINARGLLATGAGTLAKMAGGAITTTNGAAYGIQSANNASVDVSNMDININNENRQVDWGGAAGLTATTGGFIKADALNINSHGNALWLSDGRIDASHLVINQYSPSGGIAIRVIGNSELKLQNSLVTLNSPGSIAIVTDGGQTSLDGVSVKSEYGGYGVSSRSGGMTVAKNIDVAINNANSADGAGISLIYGTGKTTASIEDSRVIVNGSKATGVMSTAGEQTLILKNTLVASEDAAVRVNSNSSMNLTVEGSTLSGKYLLTGGHLYSADGRVDHINFIATAGSRLSGDVSVDRGYIDNSLLSLDASQWEGASDGLHSLNLGNGSQWNMAGDSSVGTLELANSTVVFDNAPGSFKTLTVDGDFTGNNGTLVMDSVMDGDASAHDKLVVNGNTAGTTNVVVTRAGGSGAKTLQGIELISVAGDSKGEFTQKGRIVAGAWDYDLQRGAASDAKNWYLTSEASPVNPITPVTPGMSGGAGGTVGPAAPAEMIVRPEVGNYIANIAAANTLFNLRLHDRGGETQYVDALTGEKKLTSLWMRNVGGHQQVRDGSSQLKTETNRYVMQLGGDLAGGSSNGTDSLHFGAMAGYGNARSNTDSNVTGYRSQGHTTGYNLGIYGTWYQQSEQQTGAYLDSWLQYGWFNNSVNGDHLQAEQYRSSGFTASVESGYSWKVGEDGSKNGYFIEPSAQFIWMGVKADDFNEANGTRVSSKGDGNVQSRLGVRASLKTPGETGQTVLTPYVEANWINNSKAFGSTFNGVNMRTQGEKNIGELRVALDSQLNSDLNLWGSVGQQAGSNQYRDTSAAVGVKISF